MGHRLHVVVEDLARHTAEEFQRPHVAGDQRLQPLVGDVFDEARLAPTERGDERREPRAPKLDPVDLQLGDRGLSVCRAG